MAREWGSADWERLLAERGDQLMGAAIALGGSRDAGEDLLQAALERVLRKPRQVDQDMEGYLRRVLYNLAADGWRRRGKALHATIHRASIPPRFRKLRSTDLPLAGFEPFGIPQS